MFDALKGMGALAGLLKNRDAIEGAARRVKDRLDQIRVEGSAGGGAVRVEVNGKLRVLRVQIVEATAMSAGYGPGREQLERLVLEAVNDAIEGAQAEAQRVVMEESQAMGLGDLPGLDKLLG